MRNKMLAAAVALAAAFSMSVPAESAPRRKAPASSSAAKKKAAADAAARRAAETRAAAEAAEQARLRPAWGLLAELGDKDLEYNGAPMLLRWEQPMRILRATTYGAKGNDSFLFVIDPATLKLSGRSLTAKDATAIDFFVAPTGEIMWSALGKPERFMWREKDGSIRQRWSAGSTRVFRPLDPNGRAGVTLAQMIARGDVPRLATAAAAAPATRLYTLSEALGFFRSLSGHWSNGEAIITFRNEGAQVVYDRTWDNGLTSTGTAIRVEGDQLMLADEKLAFVRGGFLLPKARWGFFPQADGTFDVRAARLSGGALVPHKDKSFTIDGKWVRLDDAQALAFRQRAEGVRVANVQAQQQRQSSGGGGMFGKMLGGALMGAMLGGGGSTSVEMAVIGATNAANGGNTLDGLNAMNGVMQTKVEEGKRQLDATIARAEAQAAAERAAKAGTGRSTPSGGAIIVSDGTAAPARPAAPVKLAKATPPTNSEVRYSFCTDSRAERKDGKIREVIHYSQIGTIRPGPNGGITFPTGFSDYMDSRTHLARSAVSENCPLFRSVAEAERDLAMKRQIERPGIRDFIFIRDFIPR